jgi:hypothetical protein
MVLAVGGLRGSGESLVMSLTGSPVAPGSGERGAMNTLGCTRAESRMGGVGAATVTLNFSTRSSQSEIDLHRSSSRSSSALGKIGPQSKLLFEGDPWTGSSLVFFFGSGDLVITVALLRLAGLTGGV